MRIFPSLFRSKKKDFILAIDLGTDTVKTCIFRVEEGKAKVSGVAHRRYPENSFLGEEVYDLDSVLETADSTIDEASLQSGHKPEQAILGVSGGVLKTISDRVKVTRAKPEDKITPAELEMVYRGVNKKVSSMAQEKLVKQEEQNAGNFLLVGISVGNFLLDEKKVLDPVGFSGSKIMLNAISRFIQNTELTVFQNLVGELDCELLAIKGGLVDLSLMLLQQTENGLIIDAGGELTQIALFKNGQFRQELSFVLGGRNWTRFLGRSLNLAFDEAEKIKIDFSLGSLDAERSEKIRPLIEEEKNYWLTGVKLALEKMRQVEGPLPEEVFLSGGGIMLSRLREDLQTVLVRDGFLSSTAKLETVNFHNWEDLEDLTGKVKEGQDDSICAQIVNFAQTM